MYNARALHVGGEVRPILRYRQARVDFFNKIAIMFFFQVEPRARLERDWARASSGCSDEGVE